MIEAHEQSRKVRRAIRDRHLKWNRSNRLATIRVRSLLFERLPHHFFSALFTSVIALEKHFTCLRRTKDLRNRPGRSRTTFAMTRILQDWVPRVAVREVVVAASPPRSRRLSRPARSFVCLGRFLSRSQLRCHPRRGSGGFVRRSV